MTNAEIQELIDEMADVQMALLYVLFRRDHPALQSLDETETFIKASDRLRRVIDQLESTQAGPPRGGHGRRESTRR